MTCTTFLICGCEELTEEDKEGFTQLAAIAIIAAAGGTDEQYGVDNNAGVIQSTNPYENPYSLEGARLRKEARISCLAGAIDDNDYWKKENACDETIHIAYCFEDTAINSCDSDIPARQAVISGGSFSYPKSLTLGRVFTCISPFKPTWPDYDEDYSCVFSS